LRIVKIVTLLLLAGCGQKGQLYLPGPSKTDMPAAEAQEAESPASEAAGDTADTEGKKDKNN